MTDGRPSRIVRLVAYRILPGLRAQLVAGHRFEDAGGDRETVLTPALGLGAVEYVVREEAEIARGGNFAGQIAGEVQIFGDDVEGAAGGEGA